MSFGSRFLRYPDLFPARRAGERWGGHTLAIDLAGGPYVFEGLSASQYTAMLSRYSEFRAEGTAGFLCSVFEAQRADFLEIETRGWEYGLDLDATATSLRLAGMQLMARIDWTPEPYAGVWTSEMREDHFIGVIENVFRPAVAYQVSSAGGLLLHSAGVVIEGRAVLFVGRSGAGKSTVAGLAVGNGLEILSDDLNVIMPGAGGWKVRNLPFTGDHLGPTGSVEYDLAAIFRLKQGSKHEVAQVSAAEAYALLVGASPYINVDEFRSPRAWDTVERLVSEVPTRCLTFKRDPGFWSMIET